MKTDLNMSHSSLVNSLSLKQLKKIFFCFAIAIDSFISAEIKQIEEEYVPMYEKLSQKVSSFLTQMRSQASHIL